MSLNLQQSKPPYVRFDYRDVEDRAASLKEGRYVSKSVAFAYVTSPGSKDESEKEAVEWLSNMKFQIGRPGKEYISQWYEHFNAIFTAWQKGHEIPETGTPVRTCPIFKPNEVTAILNANARTLEDLDTANEETLTRIGIGSRSLQARAREYIRAGKDVGATAEKMASLETRLAALEAQVVEKDEKIRELLADAKKPTKRAA